MYTGFQCLPLRILKIFSVASFGSSFSDVIFWTENQCLTTLSWHSFFLSRNAGVSSRLLPLWTCHFFFFFPIYFFLELVKEWVANNIFFFTCRYIPYILMVLGTYLCSQKIGILYQTFQKFEWTHQGNDEN